jgi:hypothetical protein
MAADADSQSGCCGAARRELNKTKPHKLNSGGTARK